MINKSAFVAESLVVSEGSGLTALVQLKQEVIDDLKAKARDSVEDFERASEEVLEFVRKEVNSGLSAFSKVSRVVLHHEAFEKTPTQKIKRFLYTLTGQKPEGSDRK